jgi:hypothetical protein
MVVVPVKQVQFVIAVDDLDFEIRNVAFEAKVLNRYGTFDRIANRSMENLGYAYLDCDLLDKATLTTLLWYVNLLSPLFFSFSSHSFLSLFLFCT